MTLTTVQKRLVAASHTSGTRNSPEAKLAGSAIRAYLKQSFPHDTLTFSMGHFYCSGFVRRGEHVVYYCFNDFRGNAESQYGLFIRTARDTKDYTGGRNHQPTLDKFIEGIEALLQIPHLAFP